MENRQFFAFRPLPVVIATALCSLLMVGVASAQLRSSDVAVRTNESQRIFVGSVTDVSARMATNTWGDHLIYSDLVIQVSETLKGEPSPTANVTVHGGEVGEVGMRVSGWPKMQLGDRAIYFVDRSPSGEWVPHGQGQGILKLNAADGVEQSDLTLGDVRTLVSSALPPAGAATSYGYRVIAKFPHDTGAFTQGLELFDNVLYEGTGLLGASSLRRVDLPTGAVVHRVDVPEQYFGEGITIFNGKIYQLTWLSGVGFIYDLATLTKTGEFNYPGEGWGLTHDDQQLIMSDGTSQIRFLDPESLQTTRTIDVVDGDAPVVRLNELEYVNGQIYANVWQTDRIARIDPETGRVTGWIDLQGLLPSGASADVLNGIAFDRTSGLLFVTGKLWPWLFQIALDPVQ